MAGDHQAGYGAGAASPVHRGHQRVQRPDRADNGGAGASGTGPEGIWAYDSTGVTIDHDVSYGNRTRDHIDGNGFGIDEDTSDSCLEYDLSYGNRIRTGRRSASRTACPG